MHSRYAIGGAVLAVILAGCAGTGDTDEVALEFVGSQVTLSEFEAEYERRADEFPFTPETRDSVLLAFASSLLDKLVMAHEAIHYPRGDTTGLARSLAHEEKNIILGMLQERVYEDVDVSAAKMDQIYEWLGEEVHVQHILLDDKDEAARVKSKIEGGMSFEDAAEAYSKDAFSAADGGTLEWFKYGDYAGLDDAAFELETGEVSDPTWTQRGWHLVKLLERRPRDRSSVEQQPALFENHYADRLRGQRWDEFLNTFYRSQDVTWHDEAYDVALALQTGYRDEYMAEVRKYKDAQAQGIQQPDVTFFLEKRGATPTPEQGSMVIASTADFDFTIKHAMDEMWMTSFDARPEPRKPHSYRAWLQEVFTEHLLVADAMNTLLPGNPDLARRHRDGVEFAQVQRLYNHEIHDQVEPTPEELQAFHEEYQEYYMNPAPLDLLVVRVSQLPDANRIGEALREGATAGSIEDRFGDVEGFSITRTGPSASWPDIEGLDGLVRDSAPYEGGKVSRVQNVGGLMTQFRIEEVGERTPMDYESAKLFVLRDCSTKLRDERTREFLDELRERYGAEIHDAVVLRADVVSPEMPESDHDHHDHAHAGEVTS